MFAVALQACSTGSWEEEHESAPWIAPGERALVFSRSSESLGSNKTWERVWRDSRGHDHGVNDIQDDIEAFLHDSGVMEAWPESQVSNEHGQERLAPFRFTVVAVDPTVVLMTPFDFGSPKGRSAYEILEPIEGRRCLGNGYMLNHLECDVTAPFAQKMRWFSHDRRARPAPIAWMDGRAEIDLGKGQRLVLTNDGSTVRTERTKD